MSKMNGTVTLENETITLSRNIMNQLPGEILSYPRTETLATLLQTKNSQLQQC